MAIANGSDGLPTVDFPPRLRIGLSCAPLFRVSSSATAMPFGIILFLLVFALGGLVTLYWVADAAVLERMASEPGALSAALAVTLLCTSLNLLLRWLRWHFLVRQLGVRVRTRESASIYLVTLPALITPYYVGELLRGVLLARNHPRVTVAIFWVWLIERASDATVLAAVWLLATGRVGIAPLPLLVVAALLFLLRRVTAARADAGSYDRLSYWGSLVVVLATTMLAWSLPIAALAAGVGLIGSELGLVHAARAFSEGTLLGAATAIPLGIGVMGSRAIAILQEIGVAADVSVLAVAAFRAGSVWYGVALGCAAVLVLRGYLARILRARTPRGHFDQIAHEYAEQIPEAVRERLIEHKIDHLRGALQRQGIAVGAKGLDLGCGQGWYAIPMARHGYQMLALDQAAGQIGEGRTAGALESLALGFAVSDARSLPLAAESMDFIYAINVFHHIEGSDGRLAALREVVRVLKPGGVFILVEMNVLNPIFRFYLSYVFPLLRSIDEGTERWLSPRRLPEAEAAEWDPEIDYFTFLPDFLPGALIGALAPLERLLESSRFKYMSAHFQACLVKTKAAPERIQPG
jgi:ubiquinone/menaquinone biosynthesis C-methylase UbiE